MLVTWAEKVERFARWTASRRCRRGRRRRWEVGALGRDGDSGLGHEDEQADGFEGDGFAAGVGAADDELTVSGVHLKGERDNGLAARAQVALHDGMTGVEEDEGVCGLPAHSPRAGGCGPPGPEVARPAD